MWVSQILTAKFSSKMQLSRKTANRKITRRVRVVIIVVRLSGRTFCAPGKDNTMENEDRVAIVSMIIENDEAVPEVNRLLHEYSEFVLCRMGLPYRKRGVNIISVAVDAPEDKISALSGRLGRLSGVTSKAVYSKKKGQQL